MRGWCGKGSSPHTRGALRCLAPWPVRAGIIPAYAGSTPGGFLMLSGVWDHPRIRGEHTHAAAIEATRPGSSPHTRGALSRGPGGGWHWKDHPRIRGEHKTVAISVNTFEGSSPHTRGAHGLRAAFEQRVGIIPAYAGSTSSSVVASSSPADHPRIRGEHIVQCAPNGQGQGSSPHTRGARVAAAVDYRDRRIIPAYAGSTWRAKTTFHTGRDHPRIRGEHSTSAEALLMKVGSSPHTRGAPRLAFYLRLGFRIIPAYAGSTTTPVVCARGCLGSSPHTRGAPGRPGRSPRRSGIIPAYAGSTSSPASPTPKGRDHPRIRGEHVEAYW